MVNSPEGGGAIERGMLICGLVDWLVDWLEKFEDRKWR
jgi:hypothetical protein